MTAMTALTGSKAKIYELLSGSIPLNLRDIQKNIPLCEATLLHHLREMIGSGIVLSAEGYTISEKRRYKVKSVYYWAKERVPESGEYTLVLENGERCKLAFKAKKVSVVEKRLSADIVGDYLKRQTLEGRALTISQLEEYFGSSRKGMGSMIFSLMRRGKVLGWGKYGIKRDTGRLPKVYAYILGDDELPPELKEKYGSGLKFAIEVCKESFQKVAEIKLLTPSRRNVLQAIKTFNLDGKMPTARDIIESLKMPEPTVDQALKDLERHGIIVSFLPKQFATTKYYYDPKILSGEALKRVAEEIESLTNVERLRRIALGIAYEATAMVSLALFYREVFPLRNEIYASQIGRIKGTDANVEFDLIVKTTEPSISGFEEFLDHKVCFSCFKEKRRPLPHTAEMCPECGNRDLRTFITPKPHVTWRIIEVYSGVVDSRKVEEFHRKLLNSVIFLPGKFNLMPNEPETFDVSGPGGSISYKRRVIRRDVIPIIIGKGFDKGIHKLCYQYRMRWMWFTHLLKVFRRVYGIKLSVRKLDRMFEDEPLETFYEGYYESKRPNDVLRANSIVWLFEKVLKRPMPDYVVEMVRELKRTQ